MNISFYKNIKKYTDNNVINKGLLKLIETVNKETLIKIDNLLFLLSPNNSSLKDLIFLISDLEASNNKYNFNYIIDIAKNSGLKTTLKTLKKLLQESSPVIPKIKNSKKNTKEQKTNQAIIKELDFKGDFFKSCPCTPDAVHCGYQVLSPAFGCKFNCSYCFLNFYQEDRKEITIFKNSNKLIDELKEFSKNNSKPVRIGTGEFTDSFAIKELDEINKKLLDLLPSMPHVVLEFKSKSENIGVFLNYKNPPRNAVISWSINPQRIIDLEEDKTISLKKRINLMKKISEKYYVGMHFDPMFMENELLEDYKRTIKDIFSNIPADKVAWISLGGYRFTENLKINTLKKSNGSKWYFGRYFEKSWDNKFRYPEKHRVYFYKEIAKTIKQYGNISVYMCMESENVWEKTKPEIDISVLDKLAILV